MKKILLLIVILFSILALVGCSKEEKKHVEEWALDYTIEYYNEEYEGYRIIAYSIEELIIYGEEQFEQWADGYEYRAYKITITNNSGKDKIYNVLIAYKQYNKLYFGIKESAIRDFDIEPL